VKPERPKRTRQRASARAQGQPALSQDDADALQSALGHRFSDPDLLTRAVTHPSALQGPKEPVQSYERLEFLGDRVLGLVIAERLFNRRRTEREGDLAPRLNRLVNKAACAAAARRVGLGEYIIMSPHEIEIGGRARESTLGDACEAVIAALYLDGGLKVARAFIERAWAAQFELRPERVKDPKTLLQEWAHQKDHATPDYRLVAREGPDHAPVFQMSVEIAGVGRARGEGPSKQEAERIAARDLLNRVDPIGEADQEGPSNDA